MKRRWGNKKGKSKKPKLVGTNDLAPIDVETLSDDNSALDESDNEEIDSGMDAETEMKPSQSAAVNQPEKLTTADSLRKPPENVAVYTRVKVRLKTSSNLETKPASLGAPVQSDTAKISLKPVSEKNEVPNEKTEESSNSLSENNGGLSGSTSKKSVGIKIKSSRGFGHSSMSPCSNTQLVKGDKMEKKDAGLLHQESRYNENDLKLALEVIRKVMTMDAAAPFNVPVNPVALGIPDYFDVIDTPMDFGTICSNLEKGVKYKNSEDVFKDVEYVWNNCYKYNNKGDYIVELMKRVKKNFIKYWTAVGLFSDQPQEANGECSSIKDGSGTPSSQGNTTPVDSGTLSLSAKKFHGLKKHKEGCQCAICVMMRRRQEREEIIRMMGGPTEDSDDSMGGEDMKQEGNLNGQSPFGGYDSPETDGGLERRGHELKLGHVKNFYENGSSQNIQGIHRSGDENNRHYQTSHIGSGSSTSSGTQKEDGNTMTDQHKPKELNEHERAKMLENLRYLDNPKPLELYRTLFTDNPTSFWNGPHSLLGPHRSACKSAFHLAISSFMKH